jgi:hypothetical protein
VPNYTKLAATAERLIKAAGRAVTLVQLESGEDNAAQPWWGTAAPRDGATEVPMTGVFLSHKDLANLGFISEAEASLATKNSKVVMFSAKEAGTSLLDEFHEVVDDEVRYRITKTHVLQPGDTRLLYAMELAR